MSGKIILVIGGKETDNQAKSPLLNEVFSNIQIKKSAYHSSFL